MSRYTAEVTASTAFGITGNNFEENAEMQEMGKLIFEPDRKKNFKMMSILLMPTISRLLRVR